MTQNIRFNHCGPQFVVKDVTQAVTFYADMLGFGIDYNSGSPPTYVVVFKDDVYIHLCNQSVIDENLGPGATFITISGVSEKKDNPPSSRNDISFKVGGLDVKGWFYISMSLRGK